MNYKIVTLSLLLFSARLQAQVIEGDLRIGIDGGSVTGQGNKLYFNGVQSNIDEMSIFRFNRIANSSDLRVNIGDDRIYGNDRFMVGTTRWEDGIYYPHLIVGDNGNVGIGTEKFGEERLAVNGKIKAREILVDNQGWPDYVFNKSYQLPKLEDIEKDILKLGHLPGIPSAQEVKEKGIELGDMNARLLQKVKS
ncbi:hypothetical protein HDF26_003820 [Pedobacter cryoconitis]|uniref:hypothetical protein n=1 Tax=Pedobacter cryoconitis TaxID=188932 RepID=UPI001610E21D|nr:hypothetical protein [Pedobacter cryoconitis]MBB6273360.1 hypothetical protein [Pedobacter cryoconitis]